MAARIQLTTLDSFCDGRIIQALDDGHVLAAAAYTNGDDCFLAWTYPFTNDCWGFAIWRDLTTAAGQKDARFIDNRVGFADDNPGPYEHKPSTEWPFQRYTWTDHGVGEGDNVTYTITPVLKTPSQLTLNKKNAATVGPLAVTADASKTTHAYFNRGTLLSQFMARRLPPNFTTKDLTKVKNDLAKNDNELRAFLMGQLGSRLIKLLDDAAAKRWHVYAALYELSDVVLVGRLAALRQRAHVVLSNGSSKKKGTDGNANAATELENVIDLHRRMLWSEGLGHNKFVVLARSPSDPFAVWTGSTNWATTGLCTQMNNAILIEDSSLARTYLDQWKRLRDDGRTGARGQALHFAPPLLAANDEVKVGGRGQGAWSVWFTRTTAGQDMEAAAELINGAKHAILFLMFEPGSAGLLQVVQARLSPAAPTYNKDLYVHGVVNTLKDDGKNVAVSLVSRGQDSSFNLRVVQPEGVADGLANWAKEVTRRDFILGQGGVIGHAIIHSKVIVIDPFTHPVVMTGSHNFSHPASAANDENLVIAEGSKALAQGYAVNIMSTYQHYRWRAYLQQCRNEHKSPWEHLAKNGLWQKKLAEHDPELMFWVH
jgi:phosphatidylserine/phosphatidylglycerophosphate/cardiolipin synthase-like enzyme